MPSLGELATLSKLYEENRPRLLAMVQRRIDPTLSIRLDAEDVLAEVYLEARRRWPNFRDRADVPAYVWLFGIARDCLFDAWRKNNRACRSPDREMPWPDASSLQLGLGLIHDQIGPRTEAERNELAHRMRSAIGQLKDSDREILWMRHFDELTFADIAAILGTTENTATVRYVRALRRLKELWQRSHDK
jgi:RNA polymerase sigma-70 factor, ECF subfamily